MKPINYLLSSLSLITLPAIVFSQRFKVVAPEPAKSEIITNLAQNGYQTSDTATSTITLKGKHLTLSKDGKQTSKTKAKKGFETKALSELISQTKE